MTNFVIKFVIFTFKIWTAKNSNWRTDYKDSYWPIKNSALAEFPSFLGVGS